jgi:hypothetical protein
MLVVMVWQAEYLMPEIGVCVFYSSTHHPWHDSAETKLMSEENNFFIGRNKNFFSAFHRNIGDKKDDIRSDPIVGRCLTDALRLSRGPNHVHVRFQSFEVTYVRFYNQFHCRRV